MKEQLINLAQEKGHDISILMTQEVDSEIYYLWMCKLKKWLRDKHGIHVNTYIIKYTKNGVLQILVDIEYSFSIDYYAVPYFTSIHDTYFSYEEALEKGLIEGLKLIK